MITRRRAALSRLACDVPDEIGYVGGMDHVPFHAINIQPIGQNEAGVVYPGIGRALVEFLTHPKRGVDIDHLVAAERHGQAEPSGAPSSVDKYIIRPHERGKYPEIVVHPTFRVGPKSFRGLSAPVIRNDWSLQPVPLGLYGIDQSCVIFNSAHLTSTYVLVWPVLSTGSRKPTTGGE